MEYCPVEEKEIECPAGCKFIKEGLCDYPYSCVNDQQQISEITRITNMICKRFGLSWHDIISRKRDDTVATARQIVMYIAYQETTMTLKQIGDYLGGRTPATVSFGYQKIATCKNNDRNISLAVKAVSCIQDKQGEKGMALPLSPDGLYGINRT